MLYRIERDLLGEMEVPKDAYYGIHTVRAIKNFPVSSFKIPEELLVALAQVKEACARANIRAGLLDKKIGNANIINALKLMINTSEVFRTYCIEGITPNKERCSRWLEESLCLVTTLAPYIGYEKAGDFARKAQMEKKTIREVAIESNLFTEDELDIIFNPQKVTRPGIPGERRLKKVGKNGRYNPQ